MMHAVVILESLGKMSAGSAATGLRTIEVQGGQHTIHIAEDLRADSGGLLWASSICLASYAEHLGRAAWRGRSVLELGSGTGFLGIALALLGAHVTVTDQDDVMEQLETSVFLNKAQLSRPISVCCEPFDWTNEPSEELQQHWDYVICADVVYTPELFGPLMNALEQTAGDGTTVVLIAYQVRHARNQAFFELLDSHGFETTEVSAEQFTACDVPVRIFRARRRPQPAQALLATRRVSNQQLYWMALNHE